MITYEQDSTLGHGSFIAVKRNGRRLGRIHFNQLLGVHQFYRETGATQGPMNADFADQDLAALKRRVEAQHNPK
jgi:hypothetical protein